MNLRKTENKKISKRCFKKTLNEAKYIPKGYDKNNYFYLLLAILLNFYYLENKKDETDSFNKSYSIYLKFIKSKDYKLAIDLFFHNTELKKNFIFLEKIKYGIDNFNYVLNNSTNYESTSIFFINISLNTKEILDYLKTFYPNYFNIIYKKIVLVFYEKKKK